MKRQSSPEIHTHMHTCTHTENRERKKEGRRGRRKILWIFLETKNTFGEILRTTITKCQELGDD